MAEAERLVESFPDRYSRRLEDGRTECLVCPRFCKLREGQRGLCFVRGNEGGRITLLSYGRSSGFCIDPIEKKPLHHFLPGTSVLSFGTAGCNLACKFCQNWDISKSRDVEASNRVASPDAIAGVARALGCRSVAFTYNDPVIFHEYAVDTAAACRQAGIRSVAVSAGYQSAGPRAEFYRHMDAANIDLKSFNEDFYQRVCGGHLQPVLETLEYLKSETGVWLEITNLLIPGENDSESELDRLSAWVLERLGPDVPLHFSAFHPDWKMLDRLSTPPATLIRAREIARRNGLRYVYLGNVSTEHGANTHCINCGDLLIGRDRYRISAWHLVEDGRCATCGTLVPGVFEAVSGDWGARRLAVDISAYA